jgi:hypothetical protein
MAQYDKVAFILRRCLGFLTWGILSFAVFSHFISPTLFVGFFMIYLGWSVCLLVETILFFVIGKRMITQTISVDWERKCKELSSESRQLIERMIHLIIIPNYKEEMEVLTDTLRILSEHPQAKNKYVICLAMEETEVGSKEKADILTPRFKDFFKKIVVTIHPKDVPGETRGKAPNVSYAVETCCRTLGQEYNLEDILVTVQDADTHFVSDYFSCLTYKYATTWDRTRVIFAPPISFYGNALEVPAPVRVTDMVWTNTVLQQLSTGRQVKFPCSCYSLSMDLCNEVGFWDKTPEAIGEDAHMFLKCLFKTDGMVRTETIYIPAGCYNVCDDTYLGSIKARYDQMYRHLWGTFDLSYCLHQAFLRGKRMKFSPKFWAFYEMFKVRVIPSTCTLVIAIIPNIMRYLFPIYNEEPYNTIFSIAGRIQTLMLVPYVILAIYYEMLHIDIVNLAVSRGCASVQHRRKLYHCIIDWFIFPIISLFFFSVCALHVHYRQMFSDHLTYVVAKKPAQISSKHNTLEEVLSVQ